eukprot:TRINITY_DN12369_c0_g1_i1.p1 TRINITY_DN12369_c0_g1~~TRINITY_DN12369_c0_g1_i1.p1  ORF type:complete len:836 (+),score=150.79 TRINITY_DN12369_c0_g1_i1:237-2510(+)
MSWKYEKSLRAVEEKHGQSAHLAERARVALTNEVERLQVLLKSVVNVPPAPPLCAADEAVEGADLRNNLFAPAWMAPVEPPETLPLPGNVPHSDDLLDDKPVGLAEQSACDAAPAASTLAETEFEALPLRSDRDASLASLAPAREANSDAFRSSLSARRALERCHDTIAPARPRSITKQQANDAAGVTTGPESGKALVCFPEGAGWSVKVEELLTEAVTLLQKKADGFEAGCGAGSRLHGKRKKSKSSAKKALKDEACEHSTTTIGLASQASHRSRTYSHGDGSAVPSLLRSETIMNLDSDPQNSAMLQSIRKTVTNAALKNTFMKGFYRPPPPVQGCLASFVNSRGFELFCSFVITMNAVFIALASNYAMTNLDAPSTHAMDVCELTFCVFYTAELALRLIVYGRYYVYSSEWAWNSFDFLLVLVSLQEMLMQFLPIDSTGINMSFLRILRVMKMVRLFRVVRLMRMFRELRLIWNSIFGCVKAIFWAMVLIISVSFMVGVCFVQASTAHLREARETVTPEEVELIKDCWGSVQTATLTLYSSVTGGVSWQEVAEGLWPIGSAYYSLFLLYILFYTCVISNTITSLFVESTMVNADKDQQVVIQNALEHTEEYIDKLRGWFSSVDKDGNGCVTYDEFCEKLQDPEAMAFASTLNIELTDLKQFFAGLSHNGTRPVNLETFVVGCIRLRGPAKSMDLLELIFHEREATEEIRQQLSELQLFCMSELKFLRSSWERFLDHEEDDDDDDTMRRELAALA